MGLTDRVALVTDTSGGPGERIARTLAAALFMCLIATCAAAEPVLHAKGRVGDQAVDTTVDSAITRYYLEEYLAGRSGPTETDQRIREALKQSDALPLTNTLLRDLTERFSCDFATLYFVDRVYREDTNRRFQQAFHAHLAAVRAVKGSLALPAAHKQYLITFVPGYAYETDPKTGADFARQRRLLDRAGLETVLIETEELANIEENARIIAQQLVRLAQRRRPIVLVSTSKAGPEVALALGRELTPGQSQAVVAWISIGGLLRGSPYADWASKWPKNWVAGLVFWSQGLKPKVIRNLTTTERRPVFESLTFPDHIFMVQWVGAPLSGHIKKYARHRYNVIKKIGPNDGLTLLADEIIPGGVVITDIGLDHYYRDPEIDLKTFALANVVLEELERKESAEFPDRMTE